MLFSHPFDSHSRSSTPTHPPTHPPESGWDTTLGHHMTDFFTNLCLCHSLIIEEDESYQGPSPDEVALVDAARQLGFEFKKRAQGKLTLSLLGKEVEYEILNVMEYSSDRGCMSVIARTPDGSVRLYCKGSDTKVMAKIRKGTNEKLLDHTNQNLYTFACEGLRTLVLGTKLIPEREYAEWDRRYQEVGVAFINRARPRTQLDRTRPNSTELDRTRPNSTKLDRTRPNSTETCAPTRPPLTHPHSRSRTHPHSRSFIRQASCLFEGREDALDALGLEIETDLGGY